VNRQQLIEIRDSMRETAKLAASLATSMNGLADQLENAIESTPEETGAPDHIVPAVQKSTRVNGHAGRRGRPPGTMPVGEPPHDEQLRTLLANVAQIGTSWEQDGKPFVAQTYTALRETAAWPIVRGALCAKYDISKGSMAAYVATMVGSHAAHRVRRAKETGAASPLVCT